MPTDLIAELKWRGLFHQCTDEAGLHAHLASGMRRGYVGYDPTADSLTIGNLVTIMLLRHLQNAGHQPVVVSGGGTGLIGDPSGKSSERTLNTEEIVRANVEGQRRIFGKLLDFSPSTKNHALITNNIDWLSKISFLDALRDIGKHFSVNAMIQRDSVRDRLQNREQGISYTEFSYILLQSYDFAHLYKDMGVTLQMGGSDQWGNIVGGVDLIRRYWISPFLQAKANLDRVIEEHELDVGESLVAQAYALIKRSFGIQNLSSEDLTAQHWEAVLFDVPKRSSDVGAAFSDFMRAFGNLSDDNCQPIPMQESFGLTAPLVTKSDGGKFGKTESGAIWLTADRTSPYAYYQFWLNTTDADVSRFLRIFTLLSKDEIERIEADHAKDPGQRIAQRTLAREATKLLHGEPEMDHAENAAKALFSGDIASLPERLLEEVLSSAPSSTHNKSLLDGEGISLIDLLVETGLAKSKRESREFLTNGSVSVNGRTVGVEDRANTTHLLHGKLIALRRGKKTWHVTRWA